MSSSTEPSRLPIAVLISGAGRTLANLIESIAAGKLNADIRLVIASKPAAGGLQKAMDARIPTAVLRRSDSTDDASYSDSVFDAIRQSGAELVVMAGFVKFVPIPDDFENRVINIHPALIPSFCGHGFYGRRVHEAVLEYGAKVSGATVHFVDNQYDHGPIVIQQSVPVEEKDSCQSLAERVFQVEKKLLPAAIQLIAENRVKIEGRRVRIDGDTI